MERQINDHSHLPDLSNRKVLVVGAGGIGCELLKNLVLAGFPAVDAVKMIYVIKMDEMYFC